MAKLIDRAFDDEATVLFHEFVDNLSGASDQVELHLSHFKNGLDLLLLARREALALVA
jgi:hypothetical protein